VRVLRGRRLRGRRTSVHILRGADQRRLLGAQRVRVPGQRTRCRQDTAGRLPVRPALLAPVPPAPDALAARPRRVLPHARTVSRRRKAPRVRPHLQHGPEYVYQHNRAGPCGDADIYFMYNGEKILAIDPRPT